MLNNIHLTTSMETCPVEVDNINNCFPVEIQIKLDP